MADWHHGFCKCFEAIPQTIFVGLCCYPAVAVLQCSNKNASEGEGGVLACLLVCLCCNYGAAFNRNKLRQRYLIRGHMCQDCVWYLLCLHVCASVQEYQEVQYQSKKPTH